MLKNVNAIVKEQGFNGVILINDFTENLLMKGYGYSNFEHDIKMTVDTPMRIVSITKQFTAVSILQLHEKGLLKFENTIRQ